MSPLSNTFAVLALLVLAAGCGSSAPAPKAGPYGTGYVKGFPIEPNGRPGEPPREIATDRNQDRDRQYEEMLREQREAEQERQQEQQQRDLDRVNNNSGVDRCLSCP